jgi:hypothetical protein
VNRAAAVAEQRGLVVSRAIELWFLKARTITSDRTRAAQVQIAKPLWLSNLPGECLSGARNTASGGIDRARIGRGRFHDKIDLAAMITRPRRRLGAGGFTTQWWVSCAAVRAKAGSERLHCLCADGRLGGRPWREVQAPRFMLLFYGRPVWKLNMSIRSPIAGGLVGT